MLVKAIVLKLVSKTKQAVLDNVVKYKLASRSINRKLLDIIPVIGKVYTVVYIKKSNRIRIIYKQKLNSNKKYKLFKRN